MLMKLFAIDPGIESTGWARWDRPRERLTPDDVGMIKGTGTEDWHKRALNNADTLKEIFDELYGYHNVHCEMPIFFASAGGHAAAQTGSLQKLCFQVGAYGRVASARGFNFTPVLVRDWKGQLPKEVVNSRIKRILGPSVCSAFEEDIWDAVGIGLWAQGAFE